MKKTLVVLWCVVLPVGPANASGAGARVPGLRELVASKAEGGGLSSDVEAGRVRPTALAAGDFDSDGVPDLVCGYTGAAGNFVTLHRGNVDSIFPYSAGARQRRLEDTFTDSPFLTPPSVFRVAPRPDFLDVGDFDLDGNCDIVVGTRGGRAFQVLTGDGAGDLRASEEVAPTAVTESEPIAVLPMRLNPDAVDDLVSLEDGRLPLVVLSSPAATITVDTALDSAVPGDGACSLREAINNANGNADTTAGDCAGGTGVDAIEFDVRGGGSPVAIVLGSALPTIVDPVIINGNTQACSSLPCVELWGDTAGVGSDGLTITAGTSTVRGLVIRDFDGDGITLDSSGNFVEGNFIGTDRSGSVSRGNFNGVFVTDADNSIGGTARGAGNLISGNSEHGIQIEGIEATGNKVQGNWIGTDFSGTVALGNDNGVVISEADGNLVGGAVPWSGNLISGNVEFGVVVIDGASANEIRGNLIGPDITISTALGDGGTGVIIQSASNNTVGGPPGAGNVISGNYAGVYILGQQSTGNQVIGNMIGTDLTGTTALGNLVGIEILGPTTSNVVGGTTPEARNVISGNEYVGVRISSGATQNQVTGNFIGTDTTGTVALGNGTYGVAIIDCSNNTIGGTSAGARNVISANGADGVLIWRHGLITQNNWILGNLIGTDVAGTVALGNAQSGVRITDATDSTIGGTSEGARNLISGNMLEGVAVEGVGSTGNAILGNAIFDNGLLGIDLNASDGVTPNDPGDADAGPNGLQNFPELTLAVAAPNDVTVQGALNSQAGADILVELFANTTCDASGHGEGERYLGYTELALDASGNADFDVVLPGPVDDGDAIVATATDALGNTSEFSTCVTAICSYLATFGQPIMALDVDTWVWGIAEDIKFAKGDLAAVGTYATTADGTVLDATSLDMSMDFPATGSGLYYLVRPLGCGSWQTAPGAQPGRDAALP